MSKTNEYYRLLEEEEQKDYPIPDQDNQFFKSILERKIK